METRTELTCYSPIEAGLEDLKKRHGNVVVDVSTREGMAGAIRGRAELRAVRLNIEKIREDEKEFFLVQGRKIDATAKRLKDIIAPMEDSYDDAIKLEQRKEKEAEALKLRELEKIKRDEEDRLKAIEKARVEAEQLKIKTDREAIEKERAEILAIKEKAEAEEKARKQKIEDEDRERRIKIEDEDRQRKLKLDEEDRLRKEKIENEQRAARAEEDRLNLAIKMAKAEEDRIAKVESDKLLAIENNRLADIAKAKREQEEYEIAVAKAEREKKEEKARQVKLARELKAGGFKLLRTFCERHGSDKLFMSVSIDIENFLNDNIGAENE